MAPAGPPSVMTYTWSNTWNEPMRLMLRQNTRVGARSGMVMDQSDWARVAPSMLAAS